MPDVNKKEQTEAGSNPPQPEVPGVPDEQQEQLPERPVEKEIAPTPPEKAPEVPEKEIEKFKERVAEAEEAEPTQKKSRISPIMKDDEVMEDLKNVMSLNKPKQVKVLVYLAFKKGIHHAVSIAKKLKDPYLMDEFHDTLVDELYTLLLKKKKIKRK